MSDIERLRRLLVIGATFVVLGLVGWLWLEPTEFGQGTFTGGLLVVLVALAAISRRRRSG